MAGLRNNCQFIGRIGNDATEHINNANTSYRFDVAVDESYTNENTGEVVKKTLWVNCWFRANAGSKIVNHLKKGVLITVSGPITVSIYNGKSGPQVNVSLEVRGYEMLQWAQDVAAIKTVKEAAKQISQAPPEGAQPVEAQPLDTQTTAKPKQKKADKAPVHGAETVQQQAAKMADDEVPF